MRFSSVNNHLLVQLIGLLLSALVALAPHAGRAEDLVVTRGDFTGMLLLTGELVAEDAVLLIVPNANVWPVTVRWLEEDGAEVARGDTIVEFDSAQLATSLEELERSALEANHQLASLRATVRSEEIEAELTYERMRAELEKARLDASVPASLVSEQETEERRLAEKRAQLEFDQASQHLELERASARARLEKQEILLEKSMRAARRAREGIDLLTLVAPRDGILLVNENEEEGRPFQSGDSTWPGRAIAQLPDLSSMIVEAQLFDVDDGRVQAGMRVSASVDAFPSIDLVGEVAEVEHIANATTTRSLRRSFRTRIRLEGLDLENMRPGMSVKVVVRDEREHVLLLPRQAIGWSEVGSVVVARAGGELQRVRIGPCNRDHCVLESGLVELDRLSALQAAEPSDRPQ